MSDRTPDGARPTGSTPETARLLALGSDAWGSVIHASREVLRRAPYAERADLAALREAPTSRLVGGRLRDELASLLGTDPLVWAAVLDRLDARVERSDELDALLRPATPERPGAGPAPDRSGRDAHRDPPAPPLPDALATTKRRVRETRRDRDAWRRRAEGADARIERLQAELAEARDQLTHLREELARTTDDLAAADGRRARAVERERRRRDAELQDLRGALAALRSADEQRRSGARRRADDRSRSAREAQRTEADALRRERGERPTRTVPGRPSRLPPGVAPGTTEAARELLHDGRLLLVDGYNVTKQHRGHLDLEMQRDGLVRQLGVLARQRGVRPTVIFDGQARGGGRPTAGLRDVVVRFTDAGITADDEIVLAVEGTDQPVVVVTDDRDLVDRVRASGADVVGTRALLGVLS